MEQSDAEEEEAVLDPLKPGLKRAAPSASRALQSGTRAPGRPPLPLKSRGQPWLRADAPKFHPGPRKLRPDGENLETHL